MNIIKHNITRVFLQGNPTVQCYPAWRCVTILAISLKLQKRRRESTENKRFLQPHCHSMPPLQGSPKNICTKLTLPETSHWLQLQSLIVWVFHWNFRGGLNKMQEFCTRVHWKVHTPLSECSQMNPFLKILRGHDRTILKEMHVKSEVRSLNHFGAIRITCL